ncbi:4-hydroxy-tetrahydrodipicolinate synthase [Streptomyces morookaense]|uniref:4-hydroxy-tetrahydrodipicolinate synthase n=1 Tax=Streptomyces morookaense TaxID=1970 RepID=A0A7Y7B3E3_STRMO|nr:4-hydroxy-tetrahydrodipicolinate synthase [Streptomyces morookaense]NVK78291.1 4-hydroxy-tetrahydrodipicolinate synthase [Streptomyces morookaense]GHF30882.1 4-hydroxy-tetrahydrodipicolinate synthase 1 [Streptomyces morookaense]
MTAPTVPPVPPFGRTVCAMVTPFTADGALDLDGAQRLADHLVGEGGCDGLVLSGTTGESPTTSDAEKSALIRAVAEAVGDRARITAGVGSPDTRHTVELARAAEAAGAHGVLVVTPYYNRPPQEDIAEHFLTVADAVGLPVMLYDIPGRTGTRIEPATMLRLAGHPRIAGVKDCAYDLLGSSKVIAQTGLAYYSGCEELNLPLRSVGGTGYVSTVANVAGPLLAAALDAFDRGAHAEALRCHQRVLPLVEAMMAAGLPGTVTAKALLTTLGLPAGPVRAPLRGAGAERVAGLVRAYEGAVGAP